MNIINQYEEDGYIITEYENGAIIKESNSIENSDLNNENDISEEEIYQAEMLLTQAKIIQKQEEQDIILAELLLNSIS